MTRSPRIRVSGNYGGAVTRFLAYAIDVALVVLLFGLGLAAIAFVLDLVSSVQVDLEEGDGLLWQIGLPTWGFLYFWVSLTITGRTPGKTVLGLRVVCRDGSLLGARRAFVRVLTFPLAFLFFGLGFVGILIDRERRAIYDLIAGTIVVYDWGDRPAELSTPLSGSGPANLARHGPRRLVVLSERGTARILLQHVRSRALQDVQRRSCPGR